MSARSSEAILDKAVSEGVYVSFCALTVTDTALAITFPGSHSQGGIYRCLCCAFIRAGHLDRIQCIIQAAGELWRCIHLKLPTISFETSTKLSIHPGCASISGIYSLRLDGEIR